jgi:hypothetical protein
MRLTGRVTGLTSPHAPRRSVRLRLTALYGVLFLAAGTVLLAISNGVAVFGSESVSHVAAVNQSPSSPPLTAAEARIRALKSQLAAESGTAHAAVSHQLLLGSVIALAVMTVISAGLGWAVAGRVLRPLRVMTAATRRISEDNLHERLAVPGPGDELKDLADTIDALLERLENAFAAQRRFVANASHELRTPLTTMRASLDVAVAKPGPVPAQTVALAGRLRAELDRVDGLLEGFLALARAQHGELPGRGPLSLDVVVAEALAARATGIAAKHLTVQHDTGDAHGTPHGTVQGSQALVTRMVENVLDNAVCHNVDGGWILVTTGEDAATGWLTVETGGRVLDQRQVAQLGQPFRRLGADRTGSDDGSGLGLSIVAAIAAAHGGTLDLRARPEGGLRVSIGLPLAPRAFEANGAHRAGARG